MTFPAQITDFGSDRDLSQPRTADPDTEASTANHMLVSEIC